MPLTKTFVYRIESETEFAPLIETLLADGGEVVKKTLERKEKKMKGLLVEECFKATIVIKYNDIWGEVEA